MSSNKNTNRVLSMLRAHRKDESYHPLCALLDLSDEMDTTISEKINIHKSIASYVEAQNKQIEFTGVELAVPKTLVINT